MRLEVTNLPPPYMEWAEILPAFLRQIFQFETVPSLHTNVLGFLFGASNSCNQLKINQASHQGTKRILL